MSTVTITEEPLGLENLLAIVDGARVELAEGVRAAITASRAVVDHALASNDAVYGLTTQVGHGKDTRLSDEQIRGEQTFLVMSHSGGVGPPLPTTHPSGHGRSRSSERQGQRAPVGWAVVVQPLRCGT